MGMPANNRVLYMPVRGQARSCRQIRFEQAELTGSRRIPGRDHTRENYTPVLLWSKLEVTEPHEAKPMTDEQSTREKWLRAYDDMMVRVKTAIEEAEESTLPPLKRYIDKARDTAVELEELTRDEAERIAYFLERDLEDAGKHMAESGHELGDWLRFDIGLIEDRLLDVLMKVADHTRLDMLQFERDLKEGPPYNTGEVTGPGTLECVSCGDVIRFHATGYIPECPSCGHTVFRRKTVTDEI
jgi:rRNA maturation endonuclease Nob1